MGRAPLTLALAALAASLPASAAAHPGHGGAIVDVGGGVFLPATTEVVEGDTVIWIWNGPDLDHTVTADTGQVESFESDPDGTPDHGRLDTYAHRFTRGWAPAAGGPGSRCPIPRT